MPEPVTDWKRYRKCPVCFAETAMPCMQMTGVGPNGPVSIEADQPHGGRELRTGYARQPSNGAH